MERAKQLAEAEGLALHDLDKEIEQREQWSVKRMVMMHGEHCYRNAELEALRALQEAGTQDAADNNGFVVACGDGILYDEDCREIILQGETVIAGEDYTEDQLWEKACESEDTYHAFMSVTAEEGSEAYAEKRERFHELIERQKKLYKECLCR